MISSWIVGSIFLDPFNIRVNGVNKAVGGGDTYLRSANTVLSLIDRLETAVQTEAAGATWTITRGRTALLQPLGGQPVAIDWLSSTNVRNLMGYTVNMPSQDTAYEAATASPLLWSAGAPATPRSREGTSGRVTNDQTRMVSADGTRSLTNQYYEQVWQDLRWTHIITERMRTDAATGGGGTFHEFHEQCFKLGASFQYYQEIDELDGSTTAVTWDDAVTNSFGPYRHRTTNPNWYQRVSGFETVDLLHPLDLPMMQVDEYT